jgi:ribose transport system ATP-binding protein
MSNATSPLLVMEQVSKSYDGVQALRAADLTVLPGEVHALLGENGAGKSTLMKILVGAVERDSGAIRIAGEPVEIRSRQDAQRLGVGVVFQHPELVEELSIVGNVTLGRERAYGGIIDRQEGRERTRAALIRLGASLEPERSAAGLRAGERQLIEVARAIAYDLRILVLDEPTASLGRREVEDLFRVIREVRDAGVAIVYISHRLDEVFELADRITVLRDGAVVGTVDVAGTTRPAVVGMMVGRSMGHAFRKESHASARVVLEAYGLETAEGLRKVSLQLHEGEVLGVYGLLGSGRTELARALFGADRLLAGRVVLNGRDVRLGSPSRAVRCGLGLVPEDRTHQGAFLQLSVTENVTLARAERFARGVFLRRHEQTRRTLEAARRLSIRTPSVDSLVSTLSGGNQQKVVFARWLVAGAQILILDDPTVGVDVGAKEEIYRIIADLTSDGTAVVFLSSELPEVLGLADRILVLRDGAAAGELEGESMTEERALALALGEAA